MKNKKSSHLFSKNKGLKIFGIGKQEAIKYFFGGNATISIIVLVTICVFLAKEAIFFFPDYKENLNIYRKTGQEVAELTEDQLRKQQEILSLVTQAKSYELYGRAGYEAQVARIFIDMKAAAEKKMKAEILGYKLANDRLKKGETVWEYLDEAEAAEKRKVANEKLLIARKALTKAVANVAPKLSPDDLSDTFKSKMYAIMAKQPEVLGELQRSVQEYYTDYEGKDRSPEYVENARTSGEKKRNELLKLDFFKNLNAIESDIRKSIPEYDRYVNGLRATTLVAKVRATAYSSAAEREEAFRIAMPQATGEELEMLKVKLKRIVTEEQDYEAHSKVILATLPEHKELTSNMQNVTIQTMAKFPAIDEFSIGEAETRVEKLNELMAEYDTFMATKRQLIEDWRYDKPIGMTKTIFGFFFGKKWVTNSTWNDFFGLKPLFGGSLWITIIAISISAPISIGAAVYVNRLATPLEQSLVKPIIEFIQAIPSVVLAFLGILVVGNQIVKYSHHEWLSWIPSFPASEGTMMLTAGILLAFMAIPTIFTLAEDALNNVPKAFLEASLAMGASRLQTIFRIILPCALSGVVAAVLLGFGRIIGETMVVLLVAGGRIAWPETMTDPVHTMTGIIAQDTGEAAAGTIQYRALFMVGLVLFCISLCINTIAQRVIKRYGNKS